MQSGNLTRLINREFFTNLGWTLDQSKRVLSVLVLLSLSLDIVDFECICTVVYLNSSERTSTHLSMTSPSWQMGSVLVTHWPTVCKGGLMGRSKLKTSSFLSYREITNRSENAAFGYWEYFIRYRRWWHIDSALTDFFVVHLNSREETRPQLASGFL